MLGAVKTKVREPRAHIDDLVVVAEFEAWPEPKALGPDVLRGLMARFRGSSRAAEAVGASEAFVRQNAKKKRGS